MMAKMNGDMRARGEKKQGTKNGHGPTTSTAGARPEMPGPRRGCRVLARREKYCNRLQMESYLSMKPISAARARFIDEKL